MGDRADPALVEVVLRRRKSTALLYWRLARPQAHVYAIALAKFVVFRTAAACLMIIALALGTFDGVVAGDIGYPNWRAPNRIDPTTFYSAIAPAAPLTSRLVPLILAFVLVLAIMPRPHRWLFRNVMVGVIAIGYFKSALPSFPQSKLSNEISSLVVSAVHSILPRPDGLIVPITGMAALSVVGYVFYRFSYTLAFRTVTFIPRRPRNHRHSTFMAVSVGRRLTAAIVTAALLAESLWLVESARLRVPEIRHAIPTPWHVQLTLAEWVLIAIAVGCVVCGSRPNGHRWRLVALLTAVTAFAFWPQNVLLLPVDIPAAPFGFWWLVIAIPAVLGVAFDVVAMLLDWPL